MNKKLLFVAPLLLLNFNGTLAQSLNITSPYFAQEANANFNFANPNSYDNFQFSNAMGCCGPANPKISLLRFTSNDNRNKCLEFTDSKTFCECNDKYPSNYSVEAYKQALIALESEAIKYQQKTTLSNLNYLLGTLQNAIPYLKEDEDKKSDVKCSAQMIVANFNAAINNKAICSATAKDHINQIYNAENGNLEKQDIFKMMGQNLQTVADETKDIDVPYEKISQNLKSISNDMAYIELHRREITKDQAQKIANRIRDALLNIPYLASYNYTFSYGDNHNMVVNKAPNFTKSADLTMILNSQKIGAAKNAKDMANIVEANLISEIKLQRKNVQNLCGEIENTMKNICDLASSKEVAMASIVSDKQHLAKIAGEILTGQSFVPGLKASRIGMADFMQTPASIKLYENNQNVSQKLDSFMCDVRNKMLKNHGGDELQLPLTMSYASPIALQYRHHIIEDSQIYDPYSYLDEALMTLKIKEVSTMASMGLTDSKRKQLFGSEKFLNRIAGDEAFASINKIINANSKMSESKNKSNEGNYFASVTSQNSEGHANTTFKDVLANGDQSNTFGYDDDMFGDQLRNYSHATKSIIEESQKHDEQKAQDPSYEERFQKMLMDQMDRLDQKISDLEKEKSDLKNALNSKNTKEEVADNKREEDDLNKTIADLKKQLSDLKAVQKKRPEVKRQASDKIYVADKPARGLVTSSPSPSKRETAKPQVPQVQAPRSAMTSSVSSLPSSSTPSAPSTPSVFIPTKSMSNVLTLKADDAILHGKTILSSSELKLNDPKFVQELYNKNGDQPIYVKQLNAKGEEEIIVMNVKFLPDGTVTYVPSQVQTKKVVEKKKVVKKKDEKKVEKRKRLTVKELNAIIDTAKQEPVKK